MASILKISEAFALAVHACALIASSEGKKLSAPDLAATLKASENHLAKVLQRLVKAGLIKSARGPRGGFTLAMDKKDVSLLRIYEVIEGRFPDGACLFDAPACGGSSCPLRGFLSKINKTALDYFKKTTLSDLN